MNVADIALICKVHMQYDIALDNNYMKCYDVECSMIFMMQYYFNYLSLNVLYVLGTNKNCETGLPLLNPALLETNLNSATLFY